MAWTTPRTWTDGEVVGQTIHNAHVRDNFNETAVAKATAAGQIFVATGLNALAARTPTEATVATSQGTTSTSYVDLATVGPTISTLTTGTQAIVFLTAQISNSGANSSFMGIDVSGATTVAAADTDALLVVGTSAVRATCIVFLTGLTPGTHTFTAKYRTTAGTATYVNRNVVVIPL